MRCYAKVRLGWELLYLGFFWRNSAQEDAVALDIDKVLQANPGAVASVSEECTGALADLPVIGEFPLLDLSDLEKRKPTELNAFQRKALESMRDGEPKLFEYKGVLTGRALVARGYAEKVKMPHDNRWWLKITEAGREKLVALGLGMPEAAE